MWLPMNSQPTAQVKMENYSPSELDSTGSWWLFNLAGGEIWNGPRRELEKIAALHFQLTWVCPETYGAVTNSVLVSRKSQSYHQIKSLSNPYWDAVWILICPAKSSQHSATAALHEKAWWSTFSLEDGVREPTGLSMKWHSKSLPDLKGCPSILNYSLCWAPCSQGIPSVKGCDRTLNSRFLSLQITN